MEKGKAGIKNATLLIAHVLVGEVGDNVIVGMT
jgi:archaellin